MADKVEKKLKKTSAKKAALIKKKPTKVAASTTKGKSIDAKIKDYFKGAFAEIKKVTWPSRKEATKLTVGVIVFSFIFVGYTTLLDYGISNAFERYILGD